MSVTTRRMLKRADFQKVKAEGSRAALQAFTLQFLKVEAEEGLCVGYTASTAAVGNSVQRNRARRRLKAAFDEVCRLNEAAAGSGLWLVLVAKKAALTIEYPYLLKDMRKALAEAGIQVERGTE